MERKNKLLQEALDKLNKNRNNNRKPQSSDMARTKSLRRASDKKVGGQFAHKGNILPMSSHIDETIIYKTTNCTGCGMDISGVGTQKFERRQVYDIPLRLTITEHKSEIKCCPHCSCQNIIKTFTIPFGKNIAEQAVRMLKLKQKISGCYRSKAGAFVFATIKSCMDTMHQNGYDIMEAIALAIRGKPIIPFVAAYSP